MAASYEVSWCRRVSPACAAVLACAVVAAAACGRGETAAIPGDAELFTVARRPLSSNVAALEAVKPQVGAEVKVGARISGRVQRLHANIRDQVRKGQVIAELEKADLEALVAQSRAEARFAEAKRAALDELYPKDIARAETDVGRWEATVALARKDLDRQRALLARTIASQIEVDRAQEALAVSEAQLLAARAALDRCGSSMPRTSSRPRQSSSGTAPRWPTRRSSSPMRLSGRPSRALSDRSPRRKARRWPPA